MATTVSGSFTIADGSLTQDALSSATRIETTKLAARSLAEYRVNFTNVRKTDGTFDENLPDSTTTGDGFLSLVGGTHGTATPMIKTADFASGSGTQSCRFTCFLPPEYVDAEDIAVKVRARLQTDADTSKTLDCLAFLEDGDGAVSGSDKCTTAAQTITTSWADYTFVITSTGVSAGDMFDIQLDVAITDSATPSGVVAEISKISFLCDTQG